MGTIVFFLRLREFACSMEFKSGKNKMEKNNYSKSKPRNKHLASIWKIDVIKVELLLLRLPISFLRWSGLIFFQGFNEVSIFIFVNFLYPHLYLKEK